MLMFVQPHGMPQSRDTTSTSQQQAVTKKCGPHYDKWTSIGLGASHFCLSCVSVAAGVMAVAHNAELYYIGVGIWAGIWVSHLNSSTIHSMVRFYKYVIIYIYKSSSGISWSKTNNMPMVSSKANSPNFEVA